MSSSHKSEFVTKNDQIKNTLNFNKPEENASNAASGTETSVSGIGTQTAPNANILDKKVEASVREDRRLSFSSHKIDMLYVDVLQLAKPNGEVRLNRRRTIISLSYA
ncbi:hypothetical protein OESDEN_07865 [Oesophagostomum dentatum]|uniref:Uncharacterized protein n=1 Tax=Oesophagostomum dentatum TaxID=61180 RepID=A0A0B1TA54_OESDE|nr:hypothetical protein OESDEN_07865 [Oesophagostomum dentatum]